MNEFRIINFNNDGFDSDFYVIEAGISHKHSSVTVTRIAKSYILHFFLKGSGEYNNEGIKPGDGFLICPNVLSSFTYYDEPWLHCRGAFGGKKAKYYLSKAGLMDNNHTFTFSDFDGVKNFAFNNIKPNKIKRTAEYMHIMFFLLSKIDFVEERTNKNYVTLAKNYIEHHFGEIIYVDDIARYVHISSKHLYKIFRNETGISVKEYIINEKRLYSSLRNKT